MAYRIIISPRAQQEIENAIDFYALYSAKAPLSFVTALSETYRVLEKNPNYRVRYKNVRAIKIRKFPYSLYFTINQDEKTIRVLSCFHNKRNPDRRP